MVQLPEIGERATFLAFAQFINLFIHFELGNEDLVDHLVVSLYRFLRKKDKLYRMEKAMLGFIKNKVPKIYRDEDRRHAFIDLKNELTEIAKDPYEKEAFSYFDFISWLDSKIENRPFGEVVKEKAVKHK